MDIEKKIELLTYQLKLMKHMIDQDTHPFFMFVLDFDFTEEQTNTLMRLLDVLRDRHQGIDRQQGEGQQLSFAKFGLNVDDIYCKQQPHYEEFATYCSVLLGDINPKHLLLALRKQEIHVDLCNHLLNK